MISKTKHLPNSIFTLFRSLALLATCTQTAYSINPSAPTGRFDFRTQNFTCLTGGFSETSAPNNHWLIAIFQHKWYIAGGIILLVFSKHCHSTSQTAVKSDGNLKTLTTNLDSSNTNQKQQKKELKKRSMRLSHKDYKQPNTNKTTQNKDDAKSTFEQIWEDANQCEVISTDGQNPNTKGIQGFSTELHLGASTYETSDTDEPLNTDNGKKNQKNSFLQYLYNVPNPKKVQKLLQETNNEPGATLLCNLEPLCDEVFRHMVPTSLTEEDERITTTSQNNHGTIILQNGYLENVRGNQGGLEDNALSNISKLRQRLLKVMEDKNNILTKSLHTQDNTDSNKN
jgi:Sec-independent protein translocase protein TatA